MQNVLFYQFLFSSRKIEFLHFMLENVPCLFTIRFIFFKFLIFRFNVCFCRLSSILHTFCYLACWCICTGCTLCSYGSRWLSSTWLLNLIIWCWWLLLLLNVWSHLVDLCTRFGWLLILCFIFNILALMNLLLLLLLHF